MIYFACLRFLFSRCYSYLASNCELFDSDGEFDLSFTAFLKI